MDVMECPDEGCDQVAELRGLFTSLVPGSAYISVECIIGHQFDLPLIRNYGEPA